MARTEKTKRTPNTPQKLHGWELFLGGVSLHSKVLFARNLSRMIASGLSLHRAVTVLQKQTSNTTFSKILGIILQGVNEGKSMSDAMAEFPRVFSVLFVSMVRAGEESGKLSESLSQIAEHLDKTYTLKKKVLGALIYPAIIVGAIVIIGILMLMFVVHTLTETFAELGVDLPATTRSIIVVSDFLANNSLMFFSVLGLAVFGTIYATRLSFMKRFFDFIFLHLPVFGTIVKQVNVSRTTRTLASLLASGVTLTRALSVTKDVVQNVYYKDVMDKALMSVQKGIPLSEVFAEHTKLFPVMVGEMIEVGEETGKLSNMFLDTAVFYETEVENKTKNLSVVVEPVLMIVVGAAVGFFALSMLTPMYSLLDSIG